MAEFATRADWLRIVRSKLTILGGCVHAIENDTRNCADTRAKARLMQREIDELIAMAYRVRQVEPTNEEEIPF
jgi:hypothetical protein